MRVLLAALALSLATPAWADAPAQATNGEASTYSALSQLQLTQSQIDAYIGSLADMEAAMGDQPADAAQPDVETMAKLDALAKKHGFKDFNDYNTIAGNISLVLDGVDPESKAYVGADKLVARSIAQVEAEPKMSPADKESALGDLRQQLKQIPALRYPANIDLVLKNYDRLNADEPAPAKVDAAPAAK